MAALTIALNAPVSLARKARSLGFIPMVALSIVVVFMLVAASANFIAPHSPTETSLPTSLPCRMSTPSERARATSSREVFWSILYSATP